MAARVLLALDLRFSAAYEPWRTEAYNARVSSDGCLMKSKNHCSTDFPEPLQVLLEMNANGTQILPNNMLAKVQDFSEANFMRSKPGLMTMLERGLRMDRQARESNEFTPEPGSSDLERDAQAPVCPHPQGKAA